MRLICIINRRYKTLSTWGIVVEIIGRFEVFMKYNSLLLSLLLVTFSTYSQAQNANLIGGKPSESFETTIFALLGPARCTATKIKDKTYITAAHCLTSRVADDKVPETIKRTLSEGELVLLSKKSEVRMFGDFNVSYIDKIHVHPSYDYYGFLYATEQLDDFTSISQAFDIAIFTVKESLGIEGVAELSDKPIGVDAELTITGYGCEDNFVDQTVPKGFIGRKKTGDLLSGTVQSDMSLAFLDDQVKLNLDKNYLYASVTDSDERVSLCPGDSGGPVFNDGKLVGISSFAYADDEGNAFNNFFSRVDLVIDWINEVTE